MKSIVNYIGLLVLLAVPLSSSAYGEIDEANFTLNSSAALYSEYVSRGVLTYRGLSFQPSSTLDYSLPDDLGKVWGGVWAHIPGSREAGDYTFVELDETLGYVNNLGDLELGLGHIWYTYFNDPERAIPDSAEIYTTVGYGLTEQLDASACWYYDYRVSYAHYVEGMLSYNLKLPSLPEGVDLKPYVSAGFGLNSEAVYAKDEGILHVTYGLSSTLPVGGSALSTLVSMTQATDESSSTVFWFGVSLSHDLDLN